MTDSPLVRRGLRVEVETTQPAEFDIKLYDVSDDLVDRIAYGLCRLPLSSEDEHLGPANLRKFDNFDVLYIVSRVPEGPLVTVVRVWPTPERERMLELLEGVNLVAMFRGATGL